MASMRVNRFSLPQAFPEYVRIAMHIRAHVRLVLLRHPLHL